ncbi:MAG: hypothetical protein ABIR56_11905 [Polaromonas sp.]
MAGLVLAWGGALAGRLRPDVRHTYGWKRASILAAFINALFAGGHGSAGLDGVPESVDLVQVRKLLLGLPGVGEVHDLHVWAMGTSHIALTAHVVLSDAGSDTGAVLHEAEHELHEHVDIRHVTLQLESSAYAHHCALRAGTGCS